MAAAGGPRPAARAGPRGASSGPGRACARRRRGPPARGPFRVRGRVAPLTLDAQGLQLRLAKSLAPRIRREAVEHAGHVPEVESHGRRPGRPRPQRLGREARESLDIPPDLHERLGDRHQVRIDALQWAFQPGFGAHRLVSRGQGSMQAKATKRPWWESDTSTPTGCCGWRATGARPARRKPAGSRPSASPIASAASPRAARPGAPRALSALDSSRCPASPAPGSPRRGRTRHRAAPREKTPRPGGGPARRRRPPPLQRLQLDLERARREDGLRVEPPAGLVGALLRRPERPVQPVPRRAPFERGALAGGEDPLGPAGVQVRESRFRVREVHDVVADAQEARPSK